MTMRAAQVRCFGAPDEVITMSDDVPIPKFVAGRGKALVKVFSVALSPGDVRFITGMVSFIRKPKDGFPYIPGADVCGKVVEIDSMDEFVRKRNISVGDIVCGTWYIVGPCEGGLAEFKLVDTKYLWKMPSNPNVSIISACTLTHSAGFVPIIYKKLLAHYGKDIENPKRVLVLGGCGGVGSILIQFLLKRCNIDYLAATSVDTQLLGKLGVHRAIDYTSEKWNEIPDFIEHKFDAIIDFGEGVQAWKKVRIPSEKSVLKPGRSGGIFIAGVNEDWEIYARSTFEVLRTHAYPIMKRQFFENHFTNHKRYPKYILFNGDPCESQNVEMILDMAAKGEIFPVVDARSPFPFSEEGVKDAFMATQSHHAHGKIVVEVSNT